jgi:predicted aspartyl protease
LDGEALVGGAVEDDPSSDNDVEISLHALTGIVTEDTMHLPVSIATKQLRALVDSGSTHSFVVSTTAHRLSLELEPCPDLTVSVTNGDRIPPMGFESKCT